jgi:seryl-tRNA synthetase
LKNVRLTRNNAQDRKASARLADIQALSKIFLERTEIEKELIALRTEHNVVNGKIKTQVSLRNSGPDASLLDTAKQLKEKITEMDRQSKELSNRLLTLALLLPNDTHPQTPKGPESAAVAMSLHGPEALKSSPARDHLTVGRRFGMIDMESGAVVTGGSWYFLRNEGALLEMALTNYAMSVAMKHGFSPVTTPDVVRADVAARCGFQPRDNAAQTYQVHTHQESKSPPLVLSGTAEIPLAGMFANRILKPESLPLKVVGLGRAFRAEAGARGADVRGLYRVHQFSKVELFAITNEMASETMMEEMLTIQKAILKPLGLRFRFFFNLYTDCYS